jgi:N-acyl-D-aspartate/D-glutamate deacylase
MKTLIKNGLLYDGTGTAPQQKDILIDNGKIEALSHSIAKPEGGKIIDASGLWVTPGLIDLHTHYDAEVEVMPSLDESLRHGVTTVVIGNCSLSAALGQDHEIVDLFARVENIPAKILNKWIMGNITWNNVREYYEHLDTLPVGPNIASFLGHSNLRIAAMGLERSFTQKNASKSEIERMKSILDEAMQAGYLGLSIDMLPYHRWAGVHNPQFLGISVPSQQASLREYHELTKVLRKYDRVLQATPNAIKKYTVAFIALLSSGLFRKPLRTTVVAALDFKSNERIINALKFAAFASNKVLRGNLKFQALAEPFKNFADGAVTPLFEEFPSMIMAISANREERIKMFTNAGYRKQFIKEWNHRSASPFYKSLKDMWVVNAPDKSLIGKNFQQLAEEVNKRPEEHFMDLLALYDTDIRWECDTANHREDKRVEMLNHPNMLPGFNDSGAHNLNFAFHDGGLQTLALAQKHPDKFSVERAVSRITKETAEFAGIDAGHLAVGKRADITIIDPERLKTDLTHNPVEQYHEKLEGSMRLVKRSGKVVRHVLVGGEEIFSQNGTEKWHPETGRKKFGKLLKSTL